MKRILIFLTVLLPWFAYNVSAQDEHDHDHEQSTEQVVHDEHKEFVRLSEAEMEEFGVEIAVAGPGTLHIEFTVPGEVAVNYDRLAHIAPRFPGVVQQVNKHLGDEVKKGDVLAVIESNEGLAPYEVRSLLDGTVIEKHITIGEVRSEESAAFVIADLSDVWVNLSIYQMHLPYVRVGQKVVISAGQELPGATGRISYLSPIVDEHTRTATAILWKEELLPMKSRYLLSYRNRRCKRWKITM
jgi:cobalt-zinc-cadmium efflux system membrane fusion protein